MTDDEDGAEDLLSEVGSDTGNELSVEDYGYQMAEGAQFRSSCTQVLDCVLSSRVLLFFFVESSRI